MDRRNFIKSCGVTIGAISSGLWGFLRKSDVPSLDLPIVFESGVYKPPRILVYTAYPYGWDPDYREKSIIFDVSEDLMTLNIGDSITVEHHGFKKDYYIASISTKADIDMFMRKSFMPTT